MSSELKKIMCVEDEADIRTITQLALETLGGYTVKMCESGQEALNTVQTFNPDLILMDVMMPGMDGPTTLTRLKSSEATAHIPVIFMTARVQSSDIQQYLSLGAISAIAKPFDPVTLSSEISKIWHQHLSVISA
ncbi:MAG: response regulator [Pseudomonadota bacterium]